MATIAESRNGFAIVATLVIAMLLMLVPNNGDSEQPERQGRVQQLPRIRGSQRNRFKQGG